MSSLKKLNRAFFRLATLFLLIVAYYHPSNCQTSEPYSIVYSSQPTVGIKIYQYDRNPEPLFQTWKKLGINTAFFGLDLASRGNFLRMAKQNGFKTFIIVPIFFNPEKLKTSPELYALTGEGHPAKDDWVEFICPGNKTYRQEMLETIKKLVSDLRPDGLSLDFIRHFVYWEKVYPDSRLDLLKTTCFCPDCLQTFQKETGIIIPPEISGYPAVSKWILSHHRKEWVDWRCHQITSMVEEISSTARAVNHFLLLNLHLVPWRENDFEGARRTVAAQDIKSLFRYVDYFSPMCYAHMVRRPPAWINSVVLDFQKFAPNPVLPSIQVKEVYRPEKLSAEEFDQSLQEALKPPSQGVIFWNWESLSESQEKQEIVRKRVVEFIRRWQVEQAKNLNQLSVSRAGLRSSPYGAGKTFPDIKYWINSSKDMARRFPGSTPTLVWIVSTMERDPNRPNEQIYTGRTRLTFPAPAGEKEKYKNIIFADYDHNEPYLKAFDRAGYKVWLQVEPAMAEVPILIDLVMERYHHHPCIIGFGVDVEWHRWSEQDNEGQAVTDEQARKWVEALRRWNPSYLLFLKHWEQSKLPPNYRQGLVFIDDSQIFQSLEEITLEFARWARWFYPSPVGFQFGYPSDRIWWNKLSDPPAEIGRAILQVAPNTSDLFWVDFTMKEIWPPKNNRK